MDKDEKFSPKEREEIFVNFVRNNERSERYLDLTDDDKRFFIRQCEAIYNKKTEQIIRELDNNGHEGSPEIRKWYRFAKELPNDST